jgi:hypothetical protein
MISYSLYAFSCYAMISRNELIAYYKGLLYMGDTEQAKKCISYMRKIF